MTRPVTEAQLKRWVGQNLYRIRHEKGLTQQQVADAGELDLRHYQRAEHGELNASLTTLAKLANGVGVDPIVLVSKPPRR